MDKQNKKLGDISHGITVRRNNPLIAYQSPNAANIRKDVEETKYKLKNLAKKYEGVNQVKGFLTDLWDALGVAATAKGQQRGGSPSRYVAFQLQNGPLLIITIRTSSHNTDVGTFTKEGNINGDFNLSIVISKRRLTSRFNPDSNVNLEEYVYLEHNLLMVESPLSKIALSLSEYLTNGIYIDTTGVAIKHTSPMPKLGETHLSPNELINQWNHTIDKITESNNCNNMRNKIRINEATFKRIIAESVKGVLNEISPELMGAAAMTAAHRAQNTDDPYYNTKYKRQANAFAHNAIKSYEKENPSMKNVYFDPYSRQIGASFKRNSNGSTLRYDGQNLDGSPRMYSETPFGDTTMYGDQYYDMDDDRLTNDSPERGFMNDPKLSDNDLRRYGRFKNKFNNTWNQMKNYQPKD